jgi:hypothetical protein
MTAQSAKELRRHLDNHLGFLRTSAELYDSGSVAEAKRLAVSIRVLVHDTKASKSLLEQLGLKTSAFIDTASERPRDIVTSYAGLAGMLLASGPSKYVPHLDSIESKPVSFEEWWKAPVIIDFKQREITRQRLILAVANKDGGAHIDPELDDIYADLSRTNSMSRMYSSDGSWYPIIGVEHASVRQVAHEMLRAFDPAYTAAVRPQQSGIVMSGLVGIVTSPTEQSITKAGRNDPCPCGSGKKYKKCHGAA